MLLDASQEVCEGGGGGEYLPTVGITVGAPLPAVCLAVTSQPLHLSSSRGHTSWQCGTLADRETGAQRGQ